MPDEKWVAWGVCVNPSCPDKYVGDMDWRRDDEKNEYAICPVCDYEISNDEMPTTREEREKLLGF